MLFDFKSKPKNMNNINNDDEHNKLE